MNNLEVRNGAVGGSRVLGVLCQRFIAIVVMSATLISASVVEGAQSKLSDAVKEAKKPVENQRSLQRESRDDHGGSGGDYCDDDSGSGYWSLLSLFVASSSDESDSYNSSSGERTRSGSRPPGEPGFEELQLGVTSLHLQLADGVLSNLGGGGLEIGGSLSSRVRLEVGGFLLRGDVREGSLAHGGIAGASELALNLQTRVYLSEHRPLGISGIAAVRYGYMSWKYENSIYAIDEYGDGAEIPRDALDNVSLFFGVGLTPFRTSVLDLSIDFGHGWRAYRGETREGFDNDLFNNAWFSQANISVSFHL